MTSLTFMWNETPAPLWKASTTNWSSSFNEITSSAASAMAAATFGGRRPAAPFVCAAAFLTQPAARTRNGLTRSPLIG